jgi:hypothetical protein
MRTGEEQGANWFCLVGAEQARAISHNRVTDLRDGTGLRRPCWTPERPRPADTDTGVHPALIYGSEGWGFETLRARSDQRPLPAMECTPVDLRAAAKCSKADDGASIRILLGDPGSPQVALKARRKTSGTRSPPNPQRAACLLHAVRGTTQGPPSGCTQRRCTTRSSGSTTTDMLVNTHVYGVPAHFAPVLHLRHPSSGTLFQTYARSSDRVRDQTRTTWTGEKVMQVG